MGDNVIESYWPKIFQITKERNVCTEFEGNWSKTATLRAHLFIHIIVLLYRRSSDGMTVLLDNNYWEADWKIITILICSLISASFHGPVSESCLDGHQNCSFPNENTLINLNKGSKINLYFFFNKKNFKNYPRIFHVTLCYVELIFEGDFFIVWGLGGPA